MTTLSLYQQKSAIHVIVTITFNVACRSTALIAHGASLTTSTTSSGCRRISLLHGPMPKRKFGTTNSHTESNEHTCNGDMSVQYFLLKSEPSDYSITDLERDCTEEWNGVRNYQARNFLRTMKVGDRAFFYHSKAATPALTGIVGTCRIAREARPDTTSFDPKSEYFDAKCTKENCRWDSVLVEYEQTFPIVLSLKEIKAIASNEPDGLIAQLPLLKQSRLSVVALNAEQWREVMRLIDEKIAGQNIEETKER